MKTTSINGFTPIVFKGNWSLGSYPSDSLVRSSGQMYISKENTTATISDGSKWESISGPPVSMAYFTESYNPNAYQGGNPSYAFACVLTPKLDAEANVSFVFHPKGVGSIARHVPTTGTKPPTNPNVRGQYSVDLQYTRNNPKEVTNADFSFAAGSTNTCKKDYYAIRPDNDGRYSCAIGSGHAVSGRSSASIGNGGIIDGGCSFGAGAQAEDFATRCCFAFGSEGQNSSATSFNGFNQVLVFAEALAGVDTFLTTSDILDGIGYPTLNNLINIEIDVLLLTPSGGAARWEYRDIFNGVGATAGFKGVGAVVKTFDNIAFLSIGPPNIEFSVDVPNKKIFIKGVSCEEGGKWLARVKVVF